MFADDGGGSIEGLGVGEVKEASAAAIEQMRENMRRATEAIKKIKKDEAKKKKKEMNLVDILIKFLQDNTDRDLLGLVVLLLEQKVPAGFIITLLSLGFEDIERQLLLEIENQDKDLLAIAAGKEQGMQQAIEQQEKRDFDSENLPDFVKDRINEWVRLLILSVMEERDDVLGSVFPDGKLVSSVLTLSARVIQIYCKKVNIDAEIDATKDFSKFIMSGIYLQLGVRNKINEQIEG